MTLRWGTPYVLTGLGLIGGLVIVQFGPLPDTVLNLLIAGAFLAVAAASVPYLIAAHSGPDERGPDF